MSKPIFAALLQRSAKSRGAGPDKCVVLLLDNAGLQTRSNLAVPDGLRIVSLPPYGPELQPAQTPWAMVDEPIVDELVPTWTRSCKSSQGDAVIPPSVRPVSGRT